MKKTYYLTLMGLAVIIGIGVIFFNKTDNKRVPKQGIYFLKQNSFYSKKPSEETKITLDFYEVSNNSSINTYIDSCKKIVLISDTGEEYPLDLNKDDIYNEKREIQLNNHLIARKYNMDISCSELENSKIIGVRFKDKDEKWIYQNLGYIEIYTTTDLQKEIIVSSNRIQWESFIQPTFNHAEFNVSNNEKQDIEIDRLSYGKTEIIQKNNDIYKINAGEEKTLYVDLEIQNEKKGEPIYYNLKPIINCICNGEKREIVCNNVYREAYYGTQKEIKEYLFKISEEVEDEKNK